MKLQMKPSHTISRRDLLLLLGVALAYGAAAAIGLYLSRSAGRIATLWPPNGVLLAAVLIGRIELRRAVLCVGALASLSANLLTAHGFAASLILTLGNIVEVWTAATLIRRFGASDDLFFKAAGVVRFTALGGVLAPALAATITTGMLWAAGLEDRLLSTWSRWFTGDALGILIVTPLVMLAAIVTRRGFGRIYVPRSIWEIAAINCALVCMAAFVFLWRSPPLLFFIFPLVLLAVFRLGPLGGAVATLTVALIGSAFTIEGLGPIAHVGDNDAERILYLQLFLATMFLTSLPVAAVLTERLALERALETARQSAEREADDLYRQVTTDELTGVASRRYFLGQLSLATDQAQRTGTAVTLAILDIDHFKNVNDTHGHLTGDDVLRRISLICQQQLRSTDIIGRLGGEEFGILMPGAGVGEARQICERLREDIARQSVHANGDGHPVRVTVSIGLAGFGNLSTDDWLGRADAALYMAKSHGRNRLHLAAL